MKERNEYENQRNDEGEGVLLITALADKRCLVVPVILGIMLRMPFGDDAVL